LSDLNNEKHIALLEELKIKSTDLKEKILINTNKINLYNEKLYDITSQRSVLNSSLNQLNNELINLKSELLSLKNNYDNYVEPTANNIIADIKKQGKLLLSDKEKNSDRIQKLKTENISLNTLKDILSEDGIRKGIITSMVVPINQKLKKYLEFINFPYDVELDDNFDAIVYERGVSINHETISNGEARMLNLCIAIAYIDMIIKNNEINILFMDEVFSSIQIDNISMLVNLLRTFSTENNISLILVHHGLEQLNSKLFDKIITVDKQLFSDLKIN
jgi:DNA repair exonuclease SbcCD ATPase subunit